MVEIILHNETAINVSNGGERVRIRKDEWTGDWAAVDETKEYPQPTYLRTKDDAIIYALSTLAVLENGSYDVAPERC